ncbi:MAG: hypothetical protein MHPSP_002503, partial [Paramarteilia canceri]
LSSESKFKSENLQINDFNSEDIQNKSEKNNVNFKQRPKILNDMESKSPNKSENYSFDNILALKTSKNNLKLKNIQSEHLYEEYDDSLVGTNTKDDFKDEILESEGDEYVNAEFSQVPIQSNNSINTYLKSKKLPPKPIIKYSKKVKRMSTPYIDKNTSIEIENNTMSAEYLNEVEIFEKKKITSQNISNEIKDSNTTKDRQDDENVRPNNFSNDNLKSNTVNCDAVQNRENNLLVTAADNPSVSRITNQLAPKNNLNLKNIQSEHLYEEFDNSLIDINTKDDFKDEILESEGDEYVNAEFSQVPIQSNNDINSNLKSKKLPPKPINNLSNKAKRVSTTDFYNNFSKKTENSTISAEYLNDFDFYNQQNSPSQTIHGEIKGSSRVETTQNYRNINSKKNKKKKLGALFKFFTKKKFK